MMAPLLNLTPMISATLSTAGKVSSGKTLESGGLAWNAQAVLLASILDCEKERLVEVIYGCQCRTGYWGVTHIPVHRTKMRFSGRLAEGMTADFLVD